MTTLDAELLGGFDIGVLHFSATGKLQRRAGGCALLDRLGVAPGSAVPLPPEAARLLQRALQGDPDALSAPAQEIGWAGSRVQLMARRCGDGIALLCQEVAARPTGAAPAEALVADMPAALWVTGPDGRPWGNPKARELFGMAPAAAAAPVVAPLTDLGQLFHRGRPVSLAGLARLNRRGDEIELEVHRPDGSVRHVHGSTGRVPILSGAAAGGGAATVGIFLDVTERKRGEQALLGNARRFRDLADLVPVIVWTAKPDGQTDFFNRRWTELTGAPAEAGAGTGWRDFLHPDDRAGAEQAWAEYVPTGRAMEREYRLRTADGSYRWHLVRAAPIHGHAGTVAAWFGTCTDIDDKNRLEAALRDARQLAEQAVLAKSRFLAAASHDLRQPFQAMRLFLHLLLDRLNGPDRELGEKLSAAMDAGEGLLSTLLDISTLEAGRLESHPAPLRIRPLLDRLVDEFRPLFESSGLELRAHLSDALVVSDAQLLERILRNVLANAGKYTRRGGVLLACRPRGGRLAVQVWDTGVGIPADKQQSVFDEFFRIRTEVPDASPGLGLGLAIVQKAACLLGHPIGLRSTEGRGTVFTIELDLAPGVAQPVPRGRHRDRQRHFDARVLVVEDDPLQRMAIEQLLAGWGCQVLTAATPETAVAEAARSGGALDLIITDLRLPDHGSGLDAVDEVRTTLGARVPALVLTGETGPEEVAEIAARGMHVLHKPYDPRQLSRALEQLLVSAAAA